MKTLDRTKPYGTVCGEASHRYEQDGLCFNSEGKEVVTGESAPANTEPVLAQVGDKSYDLAAMDAPALHVLALEMGLKLHPRTGAEKVRSAILAAPSQPLGQNSDELNAQMQA